MAGGLGLVVLGRSGATHGRLVPLLLRSFRLHVRILRLDSYALLSLVQGLGLDLRLLPGLGCFWSLFLFDGLLFRVGILLVSFLLWEVFTLLSPLALVDVGFLDLD